MYRSLTARHGTTLIGLCALIGGAALLSGGVQPAFAGSPAVPLGGIPGIGPGTGVDVYIPNPDAQPPIAWSQGTEPPPPQGVAAFNASVVSAASQGIPSQGTSQGKSGDVGRVTPQPVQSSEDMTEEDVNQLIKDHKELRMFIHIIIHLPDLYF